MLSVMAHLRERVIVELSEKKENTCLWEERFYRILTIRTIDNYVADEVSFFLNDEQAKLIADTIYEALERGGSAENEYNK